MYDNSTLKRFWNKVKVGSPDECWLWQGRRCNGYGYLKNKYAHRISYEIHKGNIPEGLLVIHSCDTPLCINPAHLRVGTHKDNAQDMVDRRRHLYGVVNPHNKLTGSDILLLRRLYASENWTQKELALEFGISRGNAKDIVTNKMWTHLPSISRSFTLRRGEQSPASKLTEKEVIEIRHLWNSGKRGQRELGRIFGVDCKTIHKIVRHKNWTHI